jgi:S-methylmethionine-dependent homocysteine/selenocysteine methylase
MPLYRAHLPQLGDKTFLTDGGLETTLVFHEGMDLPCFASFPLLATEEGRQRLRVYYRPYIENALRHKTGFMLESVGWRASPDWGAKLGYSPEQVDALNRASIELLVELRAQYATPATPFVILGAIGPRGDGYRIDTKMSAEEAKRYHARQIRVYSETEADMVGAYTLNYVEEGLGIALAAKEIGMPLALSFTVETDGRLPSGETLREAIEIVEDKTRGAPAYYMINCAHPKHFEHVLRDGGAWLNRIRGLRANSSTKSHAELDASTEIDIGNIPELAEHYRRLRAMLPKVTVLGGCCGTDHRHVEAIADSCLAA